jgi:tetraacyldisaccharide 4'-kinase
MLYRGALALRPQERPERASIPVVSVGSIWAGGAGKTPLVAALARIGCEEGMAPAILLRGYRGEVRHGVARVPSPPGPHDVARFGDEACLHARAGEAAVYVSPDRREGAERAASEGCRVAILDDGLQHRRLARDLEIIALPAGRPLGNGRLLPRGPLREGTRALERADLIVLSHAGRRSLPSATPELPFARPGVRILSWGDHLDILPLAPGDPVPSPGARVALLCGIARPGPFRDAVEDAGYAVALIEAFPDHHAFTRRECDSVRRRAAGSGIEWILTTGKDAERLKQIAGPGGPAVCIAALSIVWNEADAESLLRVRLGEIGRKP